MSGLCRSKHVNFIKAQNYDPILVEVSAVSGDKRFAHVILIDDANGHPVDKIVAAADRHQAMLRNNILRLTPRAA